MEPQFSGGEGVAAIGGIIGLIVILGIGLLFLILYVVIWWKIFSKAGYSGALSLLMVFLPPAGFILLLILAFAEWPIQRELRSLQGGRAG